MSLRPDGEPLRSLTCFRKIGLPIICIGIYRNETSKNQDEIDNNEPTSPKASRQVVSKAANMTPPRVNAPADVSGCLK